MTKREAIEKTLRVLDEATLNGIPTPTDQLADLRDRANYLINDTVQYLAGVFKIPAVYSAVREPVKNLLGGDFFSKGYIPTEHYSARANAHSFYIETSGDVTITISDSNEVIASYTANSEGFTVTKANIDAQGYVSMTVASSYPFVVRYPAMYPCAFASDDAVPDYTPYVTYEMPEDFREFDSIYQSNNNVDFRKYPYARRVGIKSFLLPYWEKGLFEFRYWRMAQRVPVDAADDFELEVNECAEALIPLHMARALTVGNDETQALSYWLDSRFAAELSMLRTEEKGGREPIQSVYSMEW